jgi:predicted dehydrogenase
LAGVNIFLEKPMARTLAEADEMVRACETHHVKLAIAHQTRYNPRLRAVRELIAAGRLGDLVELRGRGKEDQRGGGEDLMVLGTHIFDLMRLLAGDARWCHARILQGSRPATQGDVREGGENIGPIVGDNIHATYGFDNGVIGTFGTQRAKHGASARFGLQVYGTKGIIQLTTDSPMPVYFCDEPSWFPAKRDMAWKPIDAPGVKPDEKGQAAGNQRIARDLIDAIEKDRQHVRWPGRAGNDPGGLGVAPRRGFGGTAAQKSTASAVGVVTRPGLTAAGGRVYRIVHEILAGA